MLKVYFKKIIILKLIKVPNLKFQCLKKKKMLDLDVEKKNSPFEI